MAISATPHVAHYAVSELYQTTGGTPEAQATLGFLWEATWGVFNAPLYVGFFVVLIGITLIGVAMRGSRAFGNGLSWMSVLLGGGGIVAAILQMVDPASFIGVVPFFAYMIFYFVLGMKLHRLS